MAYNPLRRYLSTLAYQIPPNASCRKFIIPKQSMEGSPSSPTFYNRCSGDVHILFKHPQVENILLDQTFVNICLFEKVPTNQWTQPLLDDISNYINTLTSIAQLRTENQSSHTHTCDAYDTGVTVEADANVDTPITGLADEVRDLLETNVNPNLKADGGYCRFVRLDPTGGERFRLIVSLEGSCVTCPSSRITLKNSIENCVTFYIPEVEEVVWENAPSATSKHGDSSDTSKENNYELTLLSSIRKHLI